VDSNPVNGTTYTANAAFGSGTQIGTGNYVVYKGTETNVAVTGLTQNTTYHFQAYEIDTDGIPVYNTDTADGNPASQKTVEGATKVVLTGPVTILKDGLGAYTLTTKNSSDEVKNVNQNTTFNLTSTTSGTGAFYSDAAGTTPLPSSQVTINSGQSTATVYYRDDTFGTPTLTASVDSGQSLTAGSKQIGVKGNNALNFDGTDDYVNVGTGPNGVQTVEFWVYPTSNTQYFIDLDGGTHYIWADSGTLTATGFATTIRINGVETTAIESNKWQHVSVSTGTAFDATNITIGKANGNFLSGKMDEVRLWSSERTEAEIRANMHRELQGNEAGMAAYYKLDMLIGTWAFDSGPGGYNGALTGDPAWKTSGAMSGPGNALDFDGTDDYLDSPKF
jgi:hypothetical protein